jgi:hypothetical protein
MDGVDDEVERRLELAATIGVDPRKLLPANSGKSRWSEFEVDAYIHGALVAGPPLERRHGSDRWADQEKALTRSVSTLGAAGKFLLTPAQAERERLESLRETDLLHSGPEAIFDRVVAAARRFFDVGAASMSLIGEDTQYFKSVFGPLRDQTPRQIALCTATLERNSMLIINDTHNDLRYANNPLVVGDPHIRFYAGYPLHGPRGWNIGTLCVIDQKPRAFPPPDQQVLRTLARIVQGHIDARTS